MVNDLNPVIIFTAETLRFSLSSQSILLKNRLFNFLIAFFANSWCALRLFLYLPQRREGLREGHYNNYV